MASFLLSLAQMTNGKPNLAWYFALASWNQAISSSLRTIRIETGGALLGCRFARERSGQRCPSDEVGMRPDQGELALLARPRHDLEQRRVKRLTGTPGT